MAKYKANIKFEGIEEKKVFEAGEEFEMTVKRAEELQKNIDDKYKGKFGTVLERIDDDKKDDDKADDKKADDKKETKKDDGEAK